MFHFFSIMILALAAAAATARADDSAFIVRTRFFYQPPAWRTALEPSLSYSTFNATATIGGVSAGETDNAYIGALTLQRGLSRFVSVGAKADYGVESQDQYMTGQSGNFQSVVGLGDIHVFGRGLIPVYDGSFIFSADVAMSPGDSVLPNNGNNRNSTDGNRFSGGATLSPGVGYQGRVSDGNIVGLLVNYSYNTNKSVTSSSNSGGSQTSFLVTGGNALTLTGFYERQLEKWFFDLDLVLRSQDENLINGSQLYISSATLTAFVFQATRKFSSRFEGFISYQGTSYPNMIQYDAGSSGYLPINGFFASQVNLGARLIF